MADLLARLQSALADRYSIERELGAGGMATVYLAEDLKHRRKVALKVLRPEIAVTVGAGRFAREIEVAARLQHPNILPLLDSGEADGFFFYVMPYVEGESLRDRLARGGELPIPDAVRLLMEVADALSHAHAHGVVHRDIKPDNVLLSGRHALVADFGVAKAVTEATGRQLLTSTGVALGTPTYMAPEQATADPHQDHRVDIYALGVLAYELLTGRAPYAATTAQEMLAAHVTAAPEPLERHRPSVPPTLAAVIMKCLAKKPADRWQTAEEVLQHLEPLATPSGGTTPAQTAPVSPTPRQRRTRTVAAAAGVIAVAAIAVLVYELSRARPFTITVSDITPVTNALGVEYQPAISPNGQEIGYVAGLIGAPQLVIRSTANVAGGGEARPADPSLVSEILPAWNPDGQFVRFWGCRAGGCGWNETGKLGGSVRSVWSPRRTSSLAWSSDGTRVVFAVADTIFTISQTDSAPLRLALHTRRFWALHSFAWSPDGRWIAYVNGNAEWRTSGNVSGTSIWVMDAKGGEPEEIVSDDHLNVSPVWLDGSHMLFVSDRDGQRGVYVVEVGRHGARGEPRIVPGIAYPHSISYSVSSRKLAWSNFTLRQNIWSYPLDRSAPIAISDGRPVTSGTQVIEEHDISPDGRWIAFDNNRRGNMDLYRMALGGGDPILVTSDSSDEFDPRWSPDGREIAYFAAVPGAGGGSASVMLIAADGGPHTILASSPAGFNDYPHWSPSGLDIAFLSTRTGRAEVWIVSRDSVGGRWHDAVQVTGFGCIPLDWAPDGNGILCRRGLQELVTVSRQGAEVRRLHLAVEHGLTLLASAIVLGGGGGAQYSRDGRILYVPATHRDGRSGIWAIPAAGGRARLIVAADDPSVVLTGPISVGPDRLYVTVSQYESDIWVAKLHW